MTKRVILSVILLILAISLSVSSYFLLQHRFSSLGKALENAVYTNNNAQSAEDIRNEWAKSTKIFHVFLLHSDLSDLQSEIECLPDFIDDSKQFHNSCIRCFHLMKGVQESISLSFENIL